MKLDWIILDSMPVGMHFSGESYNHNIAFDRINRGLSKITITKI